MKNILILITSKLAQNLKQKRLVSTKWFRFEIVLKSQNWKLRCFLASIPLTRINEEFNRKNSLQYLIRKLHFRA